MSGWLATVVLDIRLQARSRLYAIGVGVAVLLGVVLRVLFPVDLVGRGLAAFYLLGLGGTTFMFGASMLLLEKGEGTLEALRVSTLTTSAYVFSKVVTLTAFALLESAVVFAIAARGVPTNHLWLAGGMLVLGAFYTMVGLGLAAAYTAVTSFLLPAGTLVAMVFQLPFLSLLDLGPGWLWYLIPTQAPLLLLQASFEPLSNGQYAYAAGGSALMLGGAWWFCQARFRRWVGLSGG